MIEENKRHFKFIQKGCTYCKACKRVSKVNGEYVILHKKATTAVDGSKAFRIFFVCGEKSHFNDVGYTKPVDFQALHGGNMNTDIRRYDEEEEEERLELEDWVKHSKVY